MGLADLHIHTTYSRDGTAQVETVVRYAAEKTALDVIAITDHDDIAGAQEAVELGCKYGIYVIPGSEITTAQGHLLGLFLHERVPPGLSLVETILRIGEQGGLCVAPHPMAPKAHGLGETALRTALRDPDVPGILVGVETDNAGLLYRQTNQAALQLAKRLGKAKVGSSDSHLLWTIGYSATAFAGTTPVELRTALERGATAVIRSRRLHRLPMMTGWLSRIVLHRRVSAAS